MTGKTNELRIAEEANRRLYQYLYDFYLDYPDSASTEFEYDGYLIQVDIGRNYKMVRAYDRNDKDDWNTADKIKEHIHEFTELINEAREQRMQEASEREYDDEQEIEYWKHQRL